MIYLLWYILFFCSTVLLCLLILAFIWSFCEGAGKPMPDDTWVVWVIFLAGFPLFAPFVLAKKVGEWVG